MKLPAYAHRSLAAWLLVPALALVLTGCKKNADEQSADQPSTDTTVESQQPASGTGADSLATIAPATINNKVTTNLNLATNASKAWQPDAALVYVSVELPASLGVDSGNEVYVFGSAADSANWWTYSISQDTGKFVRAIIPKEDFLGASLDPVNTSYWQMNYAEALQLAEANGGNAFRTSNSGTRVTVFLSQRAPRGWLWWTVEYTAPSGEKKALLVNPNRGEVVDEAGTEIAPPKDSTGTDTTTTTSPATPTTTPAGTAEASELPTTTP